MNVKIKISFLLIFAIIIELFASCTSQSTTVYNFDNNFKYDQSLINKKDIKKILNKCYFESKSFAGFSSATINNKPKIYLIDWTLSIMRKFQFSNDIYSNVKDSYNSIDLKSEHYTELEKLRLITSINKNLYIDNYDKKKVINLLMKHYDKHDSLFFWNNDTEDLSEKLTATGIVLEIFNNMNIKMEYSKNVEEKLLYLYNKDEYFTIGDVKENIINKGGCIISNLYLLGNLDNNKTKSRLTWLEYYNKTVYDSIGFDAFSLEILKKMIIINRYFGKELPRNQKYLAELFKTQSSFEGVGYYEDSFNVDPHYIDILLDICSYNKYEYPLKDKLIEYINGNIESGFTKLGDYKIVIPDNYYGIVLANMFGYTYDTNKVKGFLKSWFQRNIEENSTINSNDKLYDLYFTLLSYKELNIKISNEEEIVNGVDNFLNSFDYSNISISDHILYIRYGLDIIYMLNHKPSKELSKKISTYLKIYSKSNDNYTNINIADIYQINNYLGNYDIINVKVKEGLKKLYANGGYKLRINSSNDFLGEPDILSTSKALLVISSFDKISDSDRNEISNFLKTLKKSENYFSVSPNSKSSDLRTIYEFCRTSSYCV